MRSDSNTTQFTLLSFTKKDIIKLIFVYNVIYLSVCFYIGNDLAFSLFTAFLVSMISLYLFALIAIVDKLNKDKMQWHEAEGVIRKSLRGECVEIYKKKKRTKLLSVTRDASVQNAFQLINKGGEVHLDYLKCPITRGSRTNINSNDAQRLTLG